MSKVVIIGVSGEEDLYMADLDQGTVTPVDAPAHGNLKYAHDLRAAGSSVVKGVNFAVAMMPVASPAAGHMDR